MSTYYNQLSSLLINWYSKHKRNLPWRDIADPYKIWISEVVLQQTRVNQGMDYYLRFIDRFPTVDSLAKASEDEVLKYWQGLGYYSRARNLHKASKIIVEKHQGIFPTGYKDVIALPGIGAYTAAAICSFAYNLPFAVLDGNVFRVIARLFAIDTPIDTSEGRKIFQTIADELLDQKNPGTHNQAIMEFGALQCVPSNPNCEQCPLLESCQAFAKGDITSYPTKKQRVKTRNRYFNYLFIIHNNKTYLQQRKAKDIWKNLYEFPLIETKDAVLTKEKLIKHPNFKQITDGISTDIKIALSTSKQKHVLSHQNIYARCFVLEMDEKPISMKNLEEVAIENLDNYPISRLMEILIENHLGDLLV